MAIFNSYVKLPGGYMIKKKARTICRVEELKCWLSRALLYFVIFLGGHPMLWFVKNVKKNRKPPTHLKSDGTSHSIQEIVPSMAIFVGVKNHHFCSHCSCHSSWFFVFLLGNVVNPYIVLGTSHWTWWHFCTSHTTFECRKSQHSPVAALKRFLLHRSAALFPSPWSLTLVPQLRMVATESSTSATEMASSA